MDLQTADGICRKIQEMVCAKTGKAPGELNSFTAPESKRTTRPDGIVYVNDLKYGEIYPNSFLDVWYADASGADRPTIVYFHGGGFLFGDKLGGDPLAKDTSGPLGVMLRMLQEGYNLVSVNYCFAPDYRFPAQVHQCNDALLWLHDHADDLQLNMGKTILMGSSSGANMTLLLAQVTANPEYAALLEIKRTVKKETLKALAIDESALTVGGIDANMDTMGVCWMGEDATSSGTKSKLAPAQWYMGDSFFPAFVNASNVEKAFLLDANQTVAALEKVGAPYTLFYRTQEEAGELPHGYMELFETNPASRECLESFISFLKTYTKH